MNQPSPQSVISAKRRAAGFTLLEMLVSLAVSMILLTATGTAFIAVQGVYHAEGEVKGAVEGGRRSLTHLERSVRLIGYGIDPQYAIDTAAPTGSMAKDNTDVKLSDGGVLGVTDDLAFRYRDPAFLRFGNFTSVTELKLTGNIGVPLKKGLALMVACPGAQSSLVVKLTADAVANTDKLSVAAYGAPFPTVSDSCLSGTQPAFVMILRERRIRVQTLAGRPFLVMYDRLTDIANLTPQPIAADVERFQVAYVMNRPPPSGGCCSATLPVDNTGNKSWIIGDATNDPALGSGTPAPVPPAFDTPYDHARRYNLHPANVRALRFSMVVREGRTLGKETIKRRKVLDIPALENSPEVIPTDGRYRAVLTSAIRLPNMTSRSFFVPNLGDSSSGKNTWGG